VALGLNSHEQMKKRLVIVVSILGFIGVSAIAVWVSYKNHYPHGASHCCIIGMENALEMFARENAGHYPSGEASPEASLSLLARSNYVDSYTLRGMIVPEQTVRSIFAHGGLLGPDSCGWHYTDGLTLADDARIAILYCKEPLGHNGQKTKDGSRQVVFVGGNIGWISGDKWTAFLQEQKELLSKRNERSKAGRPLVDASIELPDGWRIDYMDVPYTISEQEGGASNFSGSGTSSGSSLSRDELVWYNPPFENQFSGFVTRALSFSNLESAPVTVNFSNGIPDKTNVVFKMQLKR
jgi:hypothetical protein